MRNDNAPIGEQKHEMLSSRLTIALFLAGLIACCFSNGIYNIPVLVWIWPACLVIPFREIRRRRLLIGAAAAYMVINAVKMTGFCGSGPLGDFAIGLLYGLVLLLPFLLDRWFYGRVRERTGAWAVFFLPCVYTAVLVLADLLVSLNRLGYTQINNLPLMQAAAVVGSYGLTFLILCFATTLVYGLENRAAGRAAFLPLCIYGAVMVAIMIAGGARLAFFQTTGSFNLNVASILTPTQGDFLEDTLEAPAMEESLRFLEEKAAEAADGNADLLCTAEEAFEVTDKEEPVFLEGACRAAAAEKLWMLIGIDLVNTDGSSDGLGVNRVYLIDDRGSIVEEYTKSCLLPTEKLEYASGDGEILFAEIPLKNGKTVCISSVICFDGNNSRFVSGIDDRTDVLLIPSWCWDGCDLYQTGVHRFRAVENGVSVLSSTIDAKSIAADRQGNLVSCTDEDSRGRDSLCFHYVPVAEGASRTVYHYIAPWFDWVYLAGAAVLAALSFTKKKPPENTGAAS